MKILKKSWIRLSLMGVLVMVLAAGLACSQSNEETETRGTLYLVDQDWNGQLVTTAVMRILLEQEMDHNVATKFAPADSAPLFIGLEEGDFHFVCCNWPSYSAALLEEYVDADEAKVQRVGDGWHYRRNGLVRSLLRNQRGCRPGYRARRPRLEDRR